MRLAVLRLQPIRKMNVHKRGRIRHRTGPVLAIVLPVIILNIHRAINHIRYPRHVPELAFRVLRDGARLGLVVDAETDIAGGFVPGLG